jgi:hypothetical protein
MNDPLPTKRGGLVPTTVNSLRHPFRLLVVATDSPETDAAPARATVERHRRSGLEVLVVAPASGGWLERWTSDDRPRREAEARLRRCLDELRAEGVQAEGLVGDSDLRLAIEDALRLFDADEVVVASDVGAPGRAHSRFTGGSQSRPRAA